MDLIIIEGAGKKDTIKKYLGAGYEVVATKGHVRDLPLKSLGVNVLDNFTPQYEIIKEKQDIVRMLKEKGKKVDKIYLATDPDREGEAISWHLCNILGLDEKEPVRIEFNEISKKTINNAISKPRPIDRNLVDAQQARRVLDRLVGYKISPILCKKIQANLSAGRVQSVALKLLVDRENEINAFVKEEYWTLIATLFKETKNEDECRANLAKINGKKQKITSKDEMDTVLEALKNHDYVVKNVTKSVSKMHAAPPYTTSTMQQDALNKLGLSLRKATSCAQEMYEGVNIENEGKVALITYIRTDSVRVSPDAMEMAKNYISAYFGDNYLPEKPNYYKVKKSAQDAHEAIRPISLDRTPDSLKPYLSTDNYRLYKLIYNRFLASQMTEATFDLVVAEIKNGIYEFRAAGKTPIFDGFLKVYNLEQEKKKVKKEEEDKEADDTADEDVTSLMLPKMEVGDILLCKALTPTQKFTKPPYRYTEASLIKEMEDKGIGRPATYTPTIMLLVNRNYTEKDGKYLKPTELAFKVDELLRKYFSRIINVKFTADMEDKLDQVADSGTVWQSVVEDFYKLFVEELKVADKDGTSFKEPPKETDIVCEKCGHKMVIRKGRFGEFIACGNFPACKNILSTNKSVGKCKKCDGNVVEKRSKKGTIFYGCSNYPKCDFVSWELPLDENCPKCKSYLTSKTTYGNLRKKCSNTSCDYTEIVKKAQG